MMFNCYAHGWSHIDRACPMCFLISTYAPSSTVIGTAPETTNSQTLYSNSLNQGVEQLKAENARYREALELVQEIVQHETFCNWFNKNKDPCNCLLSKISEALKGE